MNTWQPKERLIKNTSLTLFVKRAAMVAMVFVLCGSK